MDLSLVAAWLTAKLDIRDEVGANLVEYVLLVVLIAVVVVLILTQIGTKVSEKYSSGSSALT